MNLIVIESLSLPPSEHFCLRTISMFAKYNNYDVLIESRPYIKDTIYKHLKSKGCFDYISDIISHNQELGIRIDNELNYPLTILVDKICLENQDNIIKQIKMFSNINY